MAGGLAFTIAQAGGPSPPSSQKKKQKLKELRELVQDHPVSKWQRQYWNQGRLVPDCTLLTPTQLSDQGIQGPRFLLSIQPPPRLLPCFPQAGPSP